MPAYLIHGFQWPRKDIRIWVIENNLEEVAPEWLIGPESARGIHENFENLFPAELADLPNFRFIEQYNPTEHPDLKSQDYAYVCTAAIQITLNCPVDQVMSKGIPSQMYAAMSKIRDNLAVAARSEPSGWRIGWWVVYCEDEERDYAPLTSRSVADSTGEGVSLGGMVEGRTSVNDGVPGQNGGSLGRGFRRMFGRSTSKDLKKSRSLRDLRISSAATSPEPVGSPNHLPPAPPLPGTAR